MRIYDTVSSCCLIRRARVVLFTLAIRVWEPEAFLPIDLINVPPPPSPDQLEKVVLTAIKLRHLPRNSCSPRPALRVIDMSRLLAHSGLNLLRALLDRRLGLVQD